MPVLGWGNRSFHKIFSAVIFFDYQILITQQNLSKIFRPDSENKMLELLCSNWGKNVPYCVGVKMSHIVSE